MGAFSEPSPNETAGIAKLKAAFSAADKQWDKNSKKWKTPTATAAEIPKPRAEPNPLGCERTMRDGRICNLADSEDSPAFDEEKSPDVVEARLSQKTMLEVMADRTGAYLLPENYAKKCKQRDDLIQQSHSIAKKLSAAGVEGYAPSGTSEWLFDPVGFAINGSFASCAVEQPRFRRCNFIPAVAQQKRRFILRHLELWLYEHPHARFWTFTSGKRCVCSDLRDRFQELHRKISRLSAQPFMRETGARIVFRGSETGSLTNEDGGEQKDAAGQWLFHPHAHCIVELTKGRMHPDSWKGLLNNVHDFMGHHWNDAGHIADIREAAKYPMKPADVVRLNEQETVALHRALNRLHMVQPLGSLKAQISTTRDSGQMLITQPREEGTAPIARIANWNRHRRKPDLSQDEEALATILEHPGDVTDADRNRDAQVVAVLPPGPYFGPTLRPAILIRGEKFGPEEMRQLSREPRIRAIIEACRAPFVEGEKQRRAEESPIKVHRTPVTVRDSQVVEQGELSVVTAVPLTRSAAP